MRSRVTTLVLSLLVPSAVLFPLLAAGQGARAPEAATDALLGGNAKLAAKDTPGAIALFERAIAEAPRDPRGPYAIGQAYVVAGKLAEAEAAYERGLTLANGREDAALRSKLLFARADVLERQKRWADARTAWQAYADHASTLGDGGAHPETARARLAAVSAAIELETRYVEVRARIARENAKEDAGSASK